jgi:hypothetical protein
MIDQYPGTASERHASAARPVQKPLPIYVAGHAEAIECCPRVGANARTEHRRSEQPWLPCRRLDGGAIIEVASQRVTRLGGVLARRRPPTAPRRLQHSLQPGMNSRPPSRYFRLQNRGAVIQAAGYGCSSRANLRSRSRSAVGGYVVSVKAEPV